MNGASVRQALRGHLAWARSCRTAGRYDDAVRELRVALRLVEREGGADSAELAEAAAALGVLLQALGRFAEAEDALRLAIRVYERTCGPDHPGLAEPLSALGAVCQLRGDLAAAEALYRRALAIGDLPPPRRPVARGPDDGG